MSIETGVPEETTKFEAPKDDKKSILSRAAKVLGVAGIFAGSIAAEAAPGTPEHVNVPAQDQKVQPYKGVVAPVNLEQGTYIVNTVQGKPDQAINPTPMVEVSQPQGTVAPVNLEQKPYTVEAVPEKPEPVNISAPEAQPQTPHGTVAAVNPSTERSAAPEIKK